LASPHKNLVSVDWLSKNMNASDVRIVDASWHLPTSDRDGKSEYLKSHIPGAVFFDIDEISDTHSNLPHMLPPAEKFVSRVRQMGLGDSNRIVVYDGLGLFSAARVWWMFRIFGHSNVMVLDGGLPAWIAAGHTTDDEKPLLRERHFTARKNMDLVKDGGEVAGVAKMNLAEIVDARAADRFKGEAPEPRAGLRSGHIPKSKNLPFQNLLNADQTFKKPDELTAAFENAGVDLTRPIVTSCGSGVTAAILYLALEEIGHKNHALYDGSWAEWGSYQELPIETG